MKQFILCQTFLCIAASSWAGTIILSGDSSIPSGTVPVSGGNAIFFNNVLGSGTNVLIQNLDSGTLLTANNFATYFNSLAGVTATTTSALSVTNLAGVNLFISIVPHADYTAGQLAAMSSLLSGGGTLFLMGEAVGYSGGAIARPFLNNALVALGSSMSIVGASDGVFPTNAIVVPNALTAGVGTFQYGFTSYVSGGTVLFKTAGGTAFISAESTGTASTPEPGTVSMMLVGIFALATAGRKRSRIR